MKRRVLLANVTLAGRSGTEVVTRDLATGLARRGHLVTVYSPALGPVAEEIRSAGIDVVDRLDDVKHYPEIVQGHHFVQTVEAMDRFPEARALFVCHDRTAGHSIPPVQSRVRAYAAVDRNCLERLQVDWKIPAERTRLVRNAVDLDRFLLRAPLPARPHRGLAFSHYAAPGPYVDLLRKACRARQIELDVVGSGFGTQSAAPEKILPEYDIVFAKGRCALEAAAVGAAVVLCAPAGLGGMLTSGQAPALCDWNLGARVVQHPLSESSLVAEIDKYDPDDVQKLARFLRGHSSLDAALTAYEYLYEEIMAGPADGPSDATKFAWADSLLRRIQSLEEHERAVQPGDRMHALSDAEVAQLTVTVDVAPGEIAPGAAADVRATLRNGISDRPIGSWPPFPVHLSYRWLRKDGGAELPIEGVRTPIEPAIAPKSAQVATVRVEAPAESGEYVLRLTLVQETLRWLDRAPAAIYADAPVAVRFPNGPAIS